MRTLSIVLLRQRLVPEGRVERDDDEIDTLFPDVCHFEAFHQTVPHAAVSAQLQLGKLSPLCLLFCH